MKYLLVLLIVMGGIWWIRQQRSDQVQRSQAHLPEPMVACIHCGTHVPQKEMVKGHLGLYCSSTHLQAHEGRA